MTDTTATQPELTEAPAAADQVPTEDTVVAPVVDDAPPASTQLKVTTKKLTAKRAEVDEGVAAKRADGATRTETDNEPVQMAEVRTEAREVEELVFPGMPPIVRERY